MEADFGGGSISSDGGLPLLREVDRRIGLTKVAARLLCDDRNASQIEHGALTMLRQRVFGLCTGNEDLHDWNELRHDVLHQEMTEAGKALASAPTLCRFENGQDHEVAVVLNKLLVEQFIQSFTSAPEEFVLDFNATVLQRRCG